MVEHYLVGKVGWVASEYKVEHMVPPPPGLTHGGHAESDEYQGDLLSQAAFPPAIILTV